MVSKKDRKKQLDSKLRELEKLAKREHKRKRRGQSELLAKMNKFEGE